MLRKSACGMKRKVFVLVSAHPVVGAQPQTSARMAAAVRKVRERKLITSLSAFCMWELTRSQTQKPRQPAPASCSCPARAQRVVMVGSVKPALGREPAGEGGADQHQRRAGDPGCLHLVPDVGEGAADQELVGPADPDSHHRGTVFPV